MWPTAVQLHTKLRQTVRLLCVADSSPATHQTTATTRPWRRRLLLSCRLDFQWRAIKRKSVIESVNETIKQSRNECDNQPDKRFYLSFSQRVLVTILHQVNTNKSIETNNEMRLQFEVLKNVRLFLANSDTVHVPVCLLAYIESKAKIFHMKQWFNKINNGL